MPHKIFLFKVAFSIFGVQSPAFAQLTGRDGLRDIEACLHSHREKLYRIGFRGKISRSTLSDANRKRNFLIYQDFGLHLISRARNLYRDEPFALDLDQAVFALDSTTIDLCLSVFPWAHFRKTKAAIKAHTLLDLRGSIPSFISLTTGKVHDVMALDWIPLAPGSILTMDRAYNDFGRLYRIHSIPAFFVICAKKNLQYRRIKTYRKSDKAAGVGSDQLIRLTGVRTAEAYPEQLRRITFVDLKRNKRFVFLTNNLILPAVIIAEIYRQRWQIELFFKWIKQHLKIKSFYGNSANAVKTQIWIAISTCLVIAITKKELTISEVSLHTFLHILEVNMFEQRPINK
ncbi:MAG TPA: IS4 family transposase [Gammaproteobacteria bacterium]|nr:IS4 family transposase [Gammaproteobacteria bacterium]